MMSRGVFAVTPAYIGVGAGAGFPECSRAERATACPSLSKVILHSEGLGSKFLSIHHLIISLNAMPNASSQVKARRGKDNSPQSSYSIPSFKHRNFESFSDELFDSAQATAYTKDLNKIQAAERRSTYLTGRTMALHQL